VLFGSTHKSLYGPQGGLILTNSPELDRAMRGLLDVDVDTGIGLVDNPHMNRVAALGIALEELLRDRGYGTQVIKNAKALARALEDSGVPVRFGDRGYTESHQLLLNLKEERARELCHRLEKAGIFVDEGGRLGTAEVTHRGMKEEDMAGIAEAFSEVYKRGARDAVKKRVQRLARAFSR
jgi:glycine hydroxymethyltransferase